MYSCLKMAAGYSTVKKELPHINFLCQKCHQPLRLDSSFESSNSIDNQLLSDLAVPLITSSTESESNSERGPAIFSNVADDIETGGEHETNVSTSRVDQTGSVQGINAKLPPLRLISSDSGNGYAVVEQAKATVGNDATSSGNKMVVLSELFDILSDCSEVDHPLCEECTDTLLDQMDLQLRMLDDECKEYTAFLENLQKGSTKAENDEELTKKLNDLQMEEDELKKVIHDLDSEETKLLEQIETERKKLQSVKQKESKLLREYAECKQQLFDYEDDERSVDNQLKYAQTQLDKLKKTNVFNVTFHIWHSGQFGTINNFRLGRLPNVPVEWSEINAAWGQTVLLLNSLAKKMNLTFERYRLVPFGNHSYIESLCDKTKELPLYGSGGIRFFWDTKFDQAMVGFLDCLQQFKEQVEKGDSNFCLPYRMEKGRIEDPLSNTSYSIKIQFNSEEQWTKALKFVLTNLKWGLAWVSSHFANH